MSAVGPRFIRTPLLDLSPTEEQLTGIAVTHPVQRLGTAREVAEPVLWLASERAAFVTGPHYNVDSEYLAH